jgi:uncharacterized protein involved in outer membrane biogenesis
VGLELRPNLLSDPPPQVQVPAAADVGVGVPLWWRIAKWAAAIIVAVLLVDLVASQLVRPRHVKDRLNARLEAAFGRPVDVDNYSFTLWGGPTLVAEGVRVGENPRFGHEYFLRADSLAMRLRWLSLLRGRFELESLALTGPTLNVVSDSSGDWNLDEWLGHPPAPAANMVGPVRIPFVPRFRQIDVEDGRVNFKHGDDKLPFAFIGVSGTIGADGAERWRLDLNAAPWRAAELLQQAGTIHLAGSVGGTSSALRPASLQISWSDAAIPDFLRLLTGDDSGVRGTLGFAFNARTSGNGWAIEGHAQLTGMHRWDFTERTDAPSLAIGAHMTLNVPTSTLEVTDVTVEGPHSNASASGRIVWAASAPTPLRAASPLTFQVSSAAIDLNDALAWLRSFRTNVATSTTVAGFVRGQLSLSGWPARLESLTASTFGAELSGGAVAPPVRLGATTVQYDHGAFSMQPATITFDDAKNAATANSFRLETIAVPKHGAVATNASTGLHLSGGAANGGEVIAVANAFGWNVARGWQIAGPLHCDLRWPPMVWPSRTAPTGSIEIGGTGSQGASFRAPFLNLPVSGLQMRMDLKPGDRHVTLTTAQGFGAHWNGSFDRADAAAQWQFDLSADQLNAADLDRWMNPRWRESFIDRMLPFLNTSAPTAVPDDLRGEGRLSIGEFSAAVLDIKNLQGDLTVSGRDISLDDATGQLSGGKVSGAVDAQLAATPEYDIHATFSGVDLAALTGGAHADGASFGGVGWGQGEFLMQGTSRSDFARSLDCNGWANVSDATWRGVALVESLGAARFVAGRSVFDAGSGKFSCADSAIRVDDISLTSGRNEVSGLGTIDLTQNLDLQLRLAPEGAANDAAADSVRLVRVTGSVSAPQFSRAAAPHLPR